MAVVNKMKLLVVVFFTLEWVVCVGLRGDVQTEIKNIKKDLTEVKGIQRRDEEKITGNSNQVKNLDSKVSGQEIKINGIKESQDLTKVTLMAISQMVKSVDARVTDTVKALQDVSKKESEDHEELWKHKEKIQSLEGQGTVVAGKLNELSKKEQANCKDIKNANEKMLIIDEKLQNVSKKEKSDHEELNQIKIRMQSQEKGIQNLVRKEQDVQQDVQWLKSHFKSLTDEVTQLKERGILDKIHPVGSIYITFVNTKAPMDGVHGVKWELLPEGYTVMTGNAGNVGTRSGDSRLDGGYTEGHTLTVEEMPSHTHQYSKIFWYKMHYNGNDAGYSYDSTTATTTSTGGNQAHTHKLSVRTQKLMIWRRKS